MPSLPLPLLLSTLLFLVVLHAPTTCAVFTSATSVDTDDNAKIDAFDVVFDEPMNISTFVLSDFTVDGFTVVASSSLNTTTVRLEVDERIEYAYDGAATPNVNYTEGSLRTGAGGTPSTDSTVAIDGVAPRLVALYTELGVDPANLRLYFSEPVNSSLTTGEFVYTDTNGGGVGSIDSLSDADGSDRAVTLVMNTFFRGSDNTDTIAVTTDITDPTGNAALTGKTLTIPGDTPTIDLVGADIVHRDTNGNGIADEILMKANLPVDDSSVVTSGVFILELDGGDTYTISGFRTGGMANDSVFIIDLDETGREPRTAASGAGFDGIAAISIGSANWKCEACASTSGFTEATGLPDTLGPVIVSATSHVPKGTVTITLSEPLDAATANTFFEYVNNAGGGATAIAAGTTNFDTGVGNVTLDAALASADIATDQVRFTSSAADAAGNVAASTAAETIENDDTTPPTITSATTVDTDSDGIADQLLIVMSEAILDSSFTLGDWDISDAGYSVTAFETDDTADDNTFSLNITAPGTSGTDATPELVYTEGSFTDLNTVNLANQTITALDGIGPRLESVTTGDSDGNGKLDQLTLVFSEPISDASVDTAAWSLSDDYQIDSHNSGDTANDATIVFVISKPSLASTDTDTEVVPTVDYNATTGSLADALTNELADIADAASTDGAGPVIISVTGALPSSNLTVTFSEPITGSPDVSDLALTAVDTMTLDSITDHTGAVLTVSTSNLELDDFEKNGSPGSSITAAAMSLSDAAGNNASTSTSAKLQNTDSTPPTVTSVTAVDTNANGKIDGFVVVMDSLISDTTVNDSLILVTDDLANLQAATTLAGFTDVPNDATFYISVTEPDTIDTTLTPTITFQVGSVADLNGNALDTQDSLAAVDAMGPVIISAASQVTFTTIVVTFSEAVYGQEGATGALVASSVATAGSLGLGIDDLSTDSDGSDNEVTLTVDAALELAAFDASSVLQLLAGATNCFDALNNTCATSHSVAVDNTDSTPPTVQSVTTLDNDADGFIDSMTLVFTEPMMDSSVLANLANLTVTGYEVAQLTTGDTADDATFVLTLTEGSTPDTGARPPLSIDGAVFRDVNGNFLAEVSDETPDDGAGPIVTFASSTVGSTLVLVRFSENVQSESGATALAASSVLVSGNTVTGVHIDNGPTSAEATFNVSTAFVLSDFPSVTVRGNSTGLVDLAEPPVAAPGAALAVQLVNQDSTKPTIVSALSGNENTDLYAETIVLTYDDELHAASVNASDFAVTDPARTISSTSLAGAQLTLHLTDPGFTNTGTTPTVTYTAGSLIDENGQAADSQSITVTDGVKPVMLSATGTVGESTVVVVFSENVTGTLDQDDFELVQGVNRGLALATANYTDGTPTSTVELQMNRNIQVGDFGGSTIFQPAAGGVLDAANNAAKTTVSAVLVSSDPDPPTLDSAVFLDADGNGRVDSVALTFSENINGSSVLGPNFELTDNTLSSAGRLATGVEHGASDSDATLTLTFAEISSGYDTGNAFELRYTQGTLVDLSGNPLASTTVTPSDGAAPALVGEATTRATQTVLTVQFSEPVYSNSDGSGALVAADFTYTDTSGDGAQTIASVAQSANALGADVFAELTMNSAFQLSDFDDTPDTVAAGTIFDATGLPVPGSQVENVITTFTTVPTIDSITTGDSDANGQLDLVTVVFSHAVLASTVDHSDFSVAGYTLTETTVASDGLSATFTLQELTSFDTDATPVVTYTAGDLVDLDGNALATTAGTAATDGAAPVVVDARSAAPQTTVTLFFSEAVTGSITSARFQFTKAGGSVTGAAAGALANQVTLTVNAPLEFADFNTQSVQIGMAGSQTGVTDSVGSAAVGTVTLTNTDTAVPTLSSLTTADGVASNTVEGKIDAIQLVFSEPLLKTSVVAGEFDVANYTILSATAQGSDTNALTVVLLVDEKEEYDSDARPLVSYTGSTLSDLNNQRVQVFTDEQPDDGVAPVVVLARGYVGGNDVFLTFSEGVKRKDSPNDPLLTVDSLVYTDVDGAGASDIFSVVDGDGRDASAQFKVDNKFTAADFANDLIRFADNTVVDLQENPFFALANSAINITLDRSLEPEADESTSTTLILAGAGAAVGLGVLIGFCVCCVARKRRNEKNQGASLAQLSTLNSQQMLDQYDEDGDGQLNEDELNKFVADQTAGTLRGSSSKPDKIGAAPPISMNDAAALPEDV